MKIDCDTCAARPVACGGCMMSVLMPAVRSASSDDVAIDRLSAVSEDDLALAEAVGVFGAVGLITPVGTAAHDITETAGRGRATGGLSVIRRAG